MFCRSDLRISTFTRKISVDTPLVDEDRQNCNELKTRLENTAHEAGFVTKSSTLPFGDFQVVNRLAIEELEAWFFGDIAALRGAYPRVLSPYNIRENTVIPMQSQVERTRHLNVC